MRVAQAGREVQVAVVEHLGARREGRQLFACAHRQHPPAARQHRLRLGARRVEGGDLGQDEGEHEDRVEG